MREGWTLPLAWGPHGRSQIPRRAQAPHPELSAPGGILFSGLMLEGTAFRGLQSSHCPSYGGGPGPS